MGAATAVVIVGLVGVCVGLWLLRGALEPEPPPLARAPEPAPEPAIAAAALPTAIPAPQPAAPQLPGPPEPPDLRGNDTVDPCTSTVDPEVPPGYETVTADGITVAWQPGAEANPGPYDAALQPIPIAYLVKGLLTEAAALTATARREQLTVIVYPSRDSFHTATHAPAWSDGVYNGAVSLAVKPRADLGVEVRALRHELMHAQLHAAVGCMPAWFNEGLAMYFAGAPPVRTWLKMLRDPGTFDLDALSVPTFAFLPDQRAERAYAESLAMIVYLVQRSGEPGLPTAIRTLQTLGRGTPRAGLNLWDRLYPGAGHRAVVDALAKKLLGASPGGELDAIFRGVVCCHGMRSVAELGCRSVPPRPGEKYWIDETGSPRAWCDATW